MTTARLIVGDAGTLTADDTAVQDRLATLGYTVTVTTSDIPGAEDVAVYAASCPAGQAGYAGAVVPMLSMSQNWAAMGLAAGNLVAATATGIVQNPSSPLAAGRTGTLTLTTGSQPSIAWYQAGFGSGADKAVYRDAYQAGIVGYESGSAMRGRTAAARRVAFGYGAAASWTADGSALFDAAMTWLAPPAPEVREGTAAGAFTFTGAATGAAPIVPEHDGTATGTFTFTGTAGGVRLSRGTAGGDLVYTGAASGQAPTVDGHAGTAASTMLWTGAADGARASSGIAVTILTWIGHAAGKTPGAPGRDITIIGGPITGSWDGKVDGGAWTAHPATGSDWEAATPVGGWTSEEITG